MTASLKPRSTKNNPRFKFEITYRRPGERWQRKIVSTRRLESVVLRLEDECAEILTRELNQGDRA